MNEVESAAMWAAYAPRGSGIAIRSSYERLKVAFDPPGPIYIGTVKYLEYETQAVPELNLFDAYLHKRTSFAHERELRIVTERHLAPGFTSSWRTEDGSPPYSGDYISTDLATLIESVHLAPFSPAWFLETVQATATAFGLAAPVVPSVLDERPVY